MDRYGLPLLHDVAPRNRRIMPRLNLWPMTRQELSCSLPFDSPVVNPGKALGRNAGHFERAERGVTMRA
jgi:hypothetical protein